MNHEMYPSTRCKLLLTFAAFLAGMAFQLPLQAQQPIDNDPILFTFGDGGAVTKSQFVQVYGKHNATDDNRYSKESVDEYLDLYINFKLKVAEAERLGYDTLPKLDKELENYREQLVQSYLFDKDITDHLMQEAYERMKKEVKTAHILILADEDASPADSLKAYNKILDIRREIVAGKDFNDAARQYSQDPSVKDNGGDLGYITAFQTVYPFESAVYNTPIGSVSQPVRSRFGYHLVKVYDQRPAHGKVKVAHIFAKLPEKADDAARKQAEDKINAIYKRLEKGESFEAIALKESDDATTAKMGGELDWFGSGQLYPEFEEAAFALKEKGDFSKPVKTPIGWHIVKLLDRKTLQSYEEVEPEIRRKVSRDSRARVSQNIFIGRLKKDYRFTQNLGNVNELKAKVGESILKGKWNVDKGVASADKTVCQLTGPDGTVKKYSQLDFARYMEQNQLKGRSKTVEATVDRLYRNYVEQLLMDLEKSQLETKHPEFAALMKEFRDGTLLFELTEKKVWNKALEDTVGLQKYFEANNDDYKWGERAKIVTFACKDEATANEVRKLAGSKKFKLSKVAPKFNKEGETPLVTLKESTLEKGHDETLDAMTWAAGKLSPNHTLADGTVIFIRIAEVQPPTNKKLAEARGYAVADYQSVLEKEWVKELRSKYPVKVNEEVLESIYK